MKIIVTVESYRIEGVAGQAIGTLQGRLANGEISPPCVIRDPDAEDLDFLLDARCSPGVPLAEARCVLELQGRFAAGPDGPFEVAPGGANLLVGAAADMEHLRRRAAAVHSQAGSLMSGGDAAGAFQALSQFVASIAPAPQPTPAPLAVAALPEPSQAEHPSPELATPHPLVELPLSRELAEAPVVVAEVAGAPAADAVYGPPVPEVVEPLVEQSADAVVPAAPEATTPPETNVAAPDPALLSPDAGAALGIVEPAESFDAPSVLVDAPSLGLAPIQVPESDASHALNALPEVAQPPAGETQDEATASPPVADPVVPAGSPVAEPAAQPAVEDVASPAEGAEQVAPVSAPLQAEAPVSMPEPISLSAVAEVLAAVPAPEAAPKAELSAASAPVTPAPEPTVLPRPAFRRPGFGMPRAAPASTPAVAPPQAVAAPPQVAAPRLVRTSSLQAAVTPPAAAEPPRSPPAPAAQTARPAGIGRPPMQPPVRLPEESPETAAARCMGISTPIRRPGMGVSPPAQVSPVAPAQTASRAPVAITRRSSLARAVTDDNEGPAPEMAASAPSAPQPRPGLTRSTAMARW